MVLKQSCLVLGCVLASPGWGKLRPATNTCSQKKQAILALAALIISRVLIHCCKAQNTEWCRALICQCEKPSTPPTHLPPIPARRKGLLAASQKQWAEEPRGGFGPGELWPPDEGRASSGAHEGDAWAVLLKSPVRPQAVGEWVHVGIRVFKTIPVG